MKDFEVYDASSAQKRLYLLHQLYGDSIIYNMPFGWIIEGHLEPLRLETAIKKMLNRHESLRTCFVTKDGEILQKVYGHLDFQLKYREIEGNSIPDIDEMIDGFVRPFNLAEVPLWRMELVQLQPGKQLLLLDIHHTICDGVSVSVLINDLMAYYTGKELPELEFQYVDYTIWQNEQWQSDRIKNQEQYWLKVFEGELPVWDMPVDYPRPPAPDDRGDTLAFKLDRDITAGLKQLVLKYNTTLYVVLLSLDTILLSKTTGQEDIVVGSPVSGRTHPEFEPIIGMFVNTLAMRNQPSGYKRYSDFLPEVSKNAFSAFENQDYPFEMLVEKLLPQRRTNQNPLFDNMFSIENFSPGMDIFETGQESLKCDLHLYREKVAKFDLTWMAFEEENQIDFFLQYRTSLFQKETMERFIRRFLRLARQVVMNPDVQISDLEIITEEEKKNVLDIFNDTGKGYPKEKSIPGLFAEQVERTPDHVALIGKSDLSDLSYSSDYPELSSLSGLPLFL